MKWTPEADEMIRRHRIQGISAIQSARECVKSGLNTSATKNSVIGRLFRLRCAGAPIPIKGHSPGKKRYAAKRRPPQRKVVLMQPRAPVLVIPDTRDRSYELPFLDTRNDMNAISQCRYPVSGEGMHMIVCGAPTVKPTSYCAYCLPVASGKGTPSERRVVAYTPSSGRENYLARLIGRRAA